uniref:Uncharacterized protein n=1 Tax=Rhizophora mucronata TaxID=61149 RepID=A0A2P2LQK3_RHIMU
MIFFYKFAQMVLSYEESRECMMVPVIAQLFFFPFDFVALELQLFLYKSLCLRFLKFKK